MTVTGGKQRAEGPLSMKRELREVLRTLEELERALRDGEARVLMLGREIKELTSLLDRLEEEKREAEKQAMTSGHMLQQLDAEMGRVGERLSVSQFGTAAPGLGTRRPASRSGRANQRYRRGRGAAAPRLSASVAVAQERMVSLKERRDLAAQNTSQHVARVAGLEERHRSATAVLDRIQSLVSEMRERVHILRTQIDASAAEKVQRENENQTACRSTGRARGGKERQRSSRRPAAVRVRTNSRAAGGDRRSACAAPASCSTRPATVAANSPPLPPSCNPMRSTWRRPA